MNTRQEDIREIHRTLDYFLEKSQVYDKYEQLQKQLRYLRKSMFPSMIVGIIMLFIGFIWFTLPLYETKIVYIQYFFSNLPLLLAILFMIIWLWPIMAGIFLVIFSIVSGIGRKRKLRAKTPKLAAVAKELTEYYDSFGECIIEAEYTNPRILERILGILESEKAETAEEATDIMIKNAHRTRKQLQSELISRCVDADTESFLGPDFFRF